MYKKIKFLGFETSNKEVEDLVKAWLVLSAAFTILLSGIGKYMINPFLFLVYIFTPEIGYYFILSLIVIGTAFVLHELGHRYMARKLKCHAEFRSFDQMLIIAFVMSFFGFILAAPGAVFISGNMNVKKNGTISLAGPLVNLIIALIILPFLLVYTSKILTYVFMINAWFGLFNLIPIGNFDGRKILRWNKPIYVIMVLVALSLMFAQSFLA